MGVEPDITHVPARSEVLHAYSSHDKVHRVFGERQLHSLEVGLTGMASWVKEHGARTSREFDDIEVMKNFPKAWSM
jgi:UDP-glucose 4-epimerase